MELLVMLEVLIFLLADVLKIVDGFSIGGHAGANQGEWNTDLDSVREMADRMHFRDFPQQSNLKSRQTPLEPVYAPQDSFVFDPFSSKNVKVEDSKTDSLKPFSTEKSNNVKYDNGMTRAEIGGGDENDDKIDVFASISYPKNVRPVLDKLSLSTKIGLLTVPAKRHQGWYVQYGKRTTPENIHNSNGNNIDNPNLIKGEMKPKLSETTREDYSTESAKGGNAEASRQIKLKLELSRNLAQLENNMKVNNMAYDIVKRIVEEKSKEDLNPVSPVKRQQGWYSQYGKRGGEEISNSFSSDLRRSLEQFEKDLKDSNITYDLLKSIIEGHTNDLSEPRMPEKRQQGWFTQYGKRSNEAGPTLFS